MIVSNDYEAGKITVDVNLNICQGEGEYYRLFVDDGVNNIADIIHPEDIERLETVIEELEHREVSAAAVRIASDESGYHWVLFLTSYSIQCEHDKKLIDISILDLLPAWSEDGIANSHNSINEDPGTGLLNKRAVTEYAKHLIDVVKPDYNVTIAIIDIDDFKAINDTYGHSFGDEVLIRASGIIRKAIEGKGIAGRIGGDEMFIILNNMRDEDDIRVVLKEIRINFEQAYKGEKEIITTCSIGCATYPADAGNFSELFNIADKLLYLAKEKGKNRYIIYEDDVHGEYIAGTGDGIVRRNDVLSYDKREIMLGVMDGFILDNNMDIYEICSKIGPCFELEDISVYAAPDWSRTAYWGIFGDCGLDIPYVNDASYLAGFDKYNVFVMDSLPMIKPLCRKLHDTLAQQKISASMHYLVGTAENPRGIIAYSKSRVAKKWSSRDIDWLCMLSHMIEKKLFG